MGQGWFRFRKFFGQWSGSRRERRRKGILRQPCAGQHRDHEDYQRRNDQSHRQVPRRPSSVWIFLGPFDEPDGHDRPDLQITDGTHPRASPAGWAWYRTLGTGPRLMTVESAEAVPTRPAQQVLSGMRDWPSI